MSKAVAQLQNKIWLNQKRDGKKKKCILYSIIIVGFHKVSSQCKLEPHVYIIRIYHTQNLLKSKEKFAYKIKWDSGKSVHPYYKK